MKKDAMPAPLFCILSGISGIVGVILIIVSFTINVGPPQDATTAQLSAFAGENYNSILWGAWLQAVGPVFIVLFAFSLIYMAGFTKRIAGWMAFFGAGILMTVSLIEITFYIGVLFKQPAGVVPIIMDLINAAQHLYFIVAAPAFFIPLGIIILSSKVLPGVLGYLAIMLGITFAVLGITTLLKLVIPPLITAFGGFQGLWWLSASITFIARAKKVPYPAIE